MSLNTHRRTGQSFGKFLSFNPRAASAGQKDSSMLPSTFPIQLNIRLHASRRTRSRLAAGLACVATLALAGCTGNGTGKPTPPPDPNYKYLSGNWQFQATATATTPAAPFNSFAGYIYEQGSEPGVDDLTQAALQVVPTSSCYTDASFNNAVTIPLTGSTQAANLHLASFTVNGQVLTLTATKDATATHLTGTYSVAGGCADGAAGTITGTEYANLTGTYNGSITGSAAKTLSLKLTQFTQGTGDGVFLVTGSATFAGLGCFTKGTLASENGGVIGSAVNLVFTTDDPQGAQAVLTGTIDSAAATFTVTSASVTGGSCPGPLGAAVLNKQ